MHIHVYICFGTYVEASSAAVPNDPYTLIPKS